jgi:alkylation response protein AidB-like acyl-CoA dehydrogenase
MDLALSKDEKMIRDSAEEFFQKECPSELIREMEQDVKGYPPGLWSKLANLGWLGLIFPEEYGGSEGNFVELVLFLEAMGKYLAPVPFIDTVLGGIAILKGGTEKQRKEFLPKIAEGEVILSIAWTEPNADYNPAGIAMRASVENDVFVIDGTKIFVPYAHIAHRLICVARTTDGDGQRGITNFLLPKDAEGITCTAIKTIASDNQHEVVFDRVRAEQEDMLGKRDEGWDIMKKVFEAAAIAQCAVMVGGAERVMEMTVDHAKKRVQFGHPIGSFQAIQHRCANMMVDLEGAKYVTYEAAWKMARGLPSSLEVSVAKAWVNQAYRRICASGHQVLGGGGVMQENDMQLYSRRAKAGEFLWGDANFHREIVVQQIGL